MSNSDELKELDNLPTIKGLPHHEQVKAMLESGSFALIVRYARIGSDRVILQWLSDRLRSVAGELNKNKRRRDEEASPPPKGRIFRVQQKNP